MTWKNVKPKSFDGNNINDGSDYSAVILSAFNLPPLQQQMMERTGVGQVLAGATFGAHTLMLGIGIEDSSNIPTLRKQLQRWFDGKDRTSKQFAIERDDGSLDRYVMAFPVGQVWEVGAQKCVVTLVIDGIGDPHYRWRLATPVTDVWNITASGQETTINNAGDDEAYPIFTIRPTSGKSDSYTYKRWIPIRWRLTVGATNYPVDIVNNSLDGATLISGGKMQADGDDVRVWVDGIEKDRWLQDLNTSTAQIWANFNFSPKVELTIADAIASTGDVATIDFNESTANLPLSGIIMIDSEAFVYTAKNDTLKRITGVTRASRGTSAAAHTAGTTAWWVQRDTWLFYGNAAATAPSVDDTYKPVFNLASTNTSWDYDNFGNDAGTGVGQWTKYFIEGAPSNAQFYGGDHGATADPYVEAGIYIAGSHPAPAQLIWFAYNVCGITNINLQNGEQWMSVLTTGLTADVVYIGSGGGVASASTIALPAAASNWESWSKNQALSPARKLAGFRVQGDGSISSARYVEASDVTLTLDSGSTPTLTVGAEQSNYLLDCVILNVTRNESIRVTYTMGVDEDLEVNTDEKTVTDLSDGSSQFQARRLVEGARLQWLPLDPGDNTIRFTDEGTNGLTLTTVFEPRYYS